MNSKIIFFDIDGTILSHRTFEISESTRNAIRKAKANGHLVFINTGRTYAVIDEGVKGVGFDGYVCGCGTYISYHGKNLLHATIAPQNCKRIRDDLKRLQIEAVLEGTHAIYFNNNSTFPKIVNLRDHYMKQYNFNVQSWDSADLSFDKLYIFGEVGNVKEFADRYQDEFDYIDRNGEYETVPKGFSKASGIEFLLSQLNIPHENTYALGDGANDIPMLKFVKHSIGMGNADGGVPDIVSFLTKDVDDGGVEYALKYYNII